MICISTGIHVKYQKTPIFRAVEKRSYNANYFTLVETIVQKDEATCLKSHSKLAKSVIMVHVLRVRAIASGKFLSC